jgi:hypothetical protein
MKDNYLLLDSYVYINEIEEYFILNEGLSFDAIYDKYIDLTKKARKILKDNNVNISSLESAGKKIGSNLKKQYENGKTPQEVSKMFTNQITSVIKTAMQPVLKKVQAMGDKVDEFKYWEKILVVVGIFCLLMVVQTACMIPLMITFGPRTGMIINAIVFAPIFEEAIKTFYITSGMPWSGTAMLFGLEFINYVVKMAIMGLSIPGAIIVRTMALAMHFSTTYIQKLIMDKTQDSPDQGKYMFAAWMAGVAIHMSWNTFGIIYDKEILTFLK